MTTTIAEHDASTPASGHRRTIDGVRRWGWIPLLAIALSIVGASWALSSPVGSSPDDDFHLASIWCSPLAPDDLCKPTQRKLEDLDADTRAAIDGGTELVRVPSRVGPEALCFAFDPTASAACQKNAVTSGFSETRANDGLYPGGLYALFGIFVSDDAGRSVLLIRFASFVISMALIVAAATVARATIRRAYILAVLATSIPLGVFLFASTNPSGVAIASVGSAFACTLSFLRSRTRRETVSASVVGLAAVTMGLSSRADAGLYLAAALVCAIIFEQGWQKSLWRRSGGLAAVVVVCLLSLTQSTQTSAAADGIGGLDGLQPLTALLWNNIVTLPALWVGSLGVGWGLGWLDTRLPDLVGMGMVAAVGGLLFWGLGDVRRSKLLAAVAAVVTITFVPMWILAADRRLVGESVQPRYLLPMLPVLVTICLLPVRRGLRDFNRTQLVLLGGTFCVAESLALHANVRRYVSGQELRGLNLNSRIEWWWPIGLSPMVLWLVGSASFVVVVVIAFSRAVTKVDIDEFSGPVLLEGDDARSATAVKPSAPQHEHILPVERDGEVSRPGPEAHRPTECQPGLLDEASQ